MLVNLCAIINIVVHPRMCIVFLSNLLTILKLPNCSSRGWLTFLKRRHWSIKREYNARDDKEPYF